jgi:uncharacterized metal-binding protein
MLVPYAQLTFLNERSFTIHSFIGEIEERHMLLLKILLVLVILFVLSLVIYFFNLDMKAASLLIPFLTKIYDKREQKNKEQY